MLRINAAFLPKSKNSFKILLLGKSLYFKMADILQKAVVFTIDAHAPYDSQKGVEWRLSIVISAVILWFFWISLSMKTVYIEKRK